MLLIAEGVTASIHRLIMILNIVSKDARSNSRGNIFSQKDIFFCWSNLIARVQFFLPEAYSAIRDVEYGDLLTHFRRDTCYTMIYFQQYSFMIYFQQYSLTTFNIWQALLTVHYDVPTI